MKSIVTFILSLLLPFFLIQCSSESGYQNSISWGHRGTKPGLFSSPRAIESNGEQVAVIDRTGRVQFLTPQGEFLHEWTLEKIDNGTPTGLEFDTDGTVWIPDTHNSRILHYTLKGELISQFGSYGEEEGQFIYPTDIAIGRQDHLYIIEYGSRDRVQVFTKGGEYLRGWGSFGEKKDQFNRPMAIEIGNNEQLYIADSVNHRIKVYSQNGELRKIFGQEGKKDGEFNFPYDLTIDPNGNVWVVEFGNHRVQKFDPDGKFLQRAGSVGTALGQLAEPWGVEVCHKNLLVADTRNHRITVFLDIISL